MAGTGGRGTIIGNALEQSNVDIAQEFTRMILAQRGYQANAKTITTGDQILMETVNLKQ
jgi:flagellar hook protein FlgE